MTDLYNPSGTALTHVIEAAAIKSLKVGLSVPIDLTLADAFLDNDPATQDAGDILVRLRV